MKLANFNGRRNIIMHIAFKIYLIDTQFDFLQNVYITCDTAIITWLLTILFL